MTLPALLAVAAAGAWLVSWLSGIALRHTAGGRRQRLLTRLHQAAHLPWTVGMLSVVLFALLPMTRLPETAQRGIRHGLVLILIGTGAWLAVRLLFVAEDTAFRRLPVELVDNRRRRRARTQIRLVRRLTAVVITVFAAGAALVTFQPLKAFGTSLLASASVAAVLIGLAGRTTLGHVFAGMQLAFTDTLRFDDVVVVEGEWGRIEEIKLTHVVVRLWDERRLVLPTTYFTDTPFQNWTRHEARVLATVTLHLDYSASADELRTEAHRIVEASPLWDRRDWVLQVIDTTESSMVVRILASAADGPSAWDLRCELLESLIRFSQARHRQWLPRTRVEIEQAERKQ